MLNTGPVGMVKRGAAVGSVLLHRSLTVRSNRLAAWIVARGREGEWTEIASHSR